MPDLWRLPAAALSSLLHRGEASSREIVGAHLGRIDAVEGRVRAFAHVFRDRALADADASDERRRRRESRGALDGVPVTVKECFDFAGQATTLGLPSRRGHVAERDAAIVEALRGAGAVVLGRTNLSQTMLFVEARNPVFGQTANPWSLRHTPGGSSGGEAAAIAAGMSPLGVGTDIGGSIRTPAHFCGVTGFKPTLDRLPMRGYSTVLSGQEAVRGMAGSMGRTVDDLALLFRALDPRLLASLDARVAPLPWRDGTQDGTAGLRVGLYMDDGVLLPSNALVRAVERAARALETRGAEVFAFEPPDVRAVLSNYLGALGADGGREIVAALSGGDVDPVLEPLRRVAAMPSALRHVLAQGARLGGQWSAALLLEAVGERSVGEFWRLTARLRASGVALLDAMDRARVDVLLCPPYATPAFPHGDAKSFTVASSYSILFNVAQFPAGVVPVTRVRLDETGRSTTRDAAERKAARIDGASAGLPVGVQLVARPFRDELLLSAMRAVETEVAGDSDFPRTPVEPQGST